LSYVWVGDTFINLELVREGYALSYSHPPDVKYQEQFVAAQKSARENGAGLWSVCREESASSTPAAQPSPAATPPACLIKGNISSSGEKIFHLPGCGSYSKTVIDESTGERWFCTEQEALSAGWRKALNCP
jgi:micrococcal nuclease